MMRSPSLPIICVLGRLDDIAQLSLPNKVAGVSESRSYRVRFSDGQQGYGDYSSVKTVATQG